MADCVPCNTPPPPCSCSAAQTCVQTPRSCSTCPRNICIADPAASARSPRSAGLGAPVGGAIGGLAAGLLIILTFWILYRRNLLPSFCTSIFESRSTKNFSSKHPHHLKNQQHRFKSNHNLSSPNEPHHQSVIYLPTDTKDPNTASIIESDDDPFSDKHSGVSIIPKQNTTTVELIASPVHPNPPTAYFPSVQRSLSITRLDAKDGQSTTADIHSPNHPADHNNNKIPSTPTLLVSHPNQRASFIPPSLPSPTHSTATQHKPVRPHRAPDLDLRLPGAAAASSPADPEGPARPSTADAADQAPSGLLSPRSEHRAPSSRRLSGSSDATTHDSHLSSILDPAMIVTPVTLVRTASGRQAAVQRVALRGQEKARVVRLPPSTHPHGPSPLSLSADSAQAGTNGRETFGFSPTTPGIGRADEQANHRSFSDLSALGAHQQEGGEREASGGTEEIAGGPPSEYARKGPNLQRSRSAAYSIASSSFGGSSVCDSFIEDEEVEFPTVLGRSAATLAQRILQQQHEQQQQQQKQQQQQQQQPQGIEIPTMATPTTHHHVNLKALGRDRAISLSSIITEEAGRETASPPPLPAMPQQRGTLPTPFKPFAGQKPSRGSGRTDGSGSNVGSVVVDSNGSDSLARLSSASSLRSGYGSVLEGIPFNIGFSSDNDELFHRPLSFDAPNGFSDNGCPPPNDDDDIDDIPAPSTPTIASATLEITSPTPPPPPPAVPATSSNLLLDPETRAALDYINLL